jgi:nicotinate dehydrogenase subunit A
VLVDGKAERSCRIPVSRIAGRRVTTLEGVGTPEMPSRVQAAFIAEQAAQCGYCANGMIMAATALLAETPRPSLDQVKDALGGNLCRCGTHTRILRAVMRASRA